KSTASNASPATNTVLPWLPPNQLVGNKLKPGLCLCEPNPLNEGGGAKTETKEAVSLLRVPEPVGESCTEYRWKCVKGSASDSRVLRDAITRPNGLKLPTGMESVDTNQDFEQGRKQTRRSWSKFEEEQLLTVLEDFVVVGHRCETGNFKYGTLLQMEKVLNNLCPGAKLKHHKNAAKWRNKSFPLFDRIANIFGKDRANGKGAEIPSEMMEE
ncbi:NB-ARC domain-containing disease resistance protein, partial [Prunus dulcis]